LDIVIWDLFTLLLLGLGAFVISIFYFLLTHTGGMFVIWRLDFGIYFFWICLVFVI